MVSFWAAGPEANGDFLRHIRIDPGQIVSTVINHPAQVAEGIANDVSKSSAVQRIADAVQDTAGSGDTSSIQHALDPAQRGVSGALEAASNALQRGANAVGAADAKGVRGALAGGSQSLSSATGLDVTGAAEALHHATGSDIAEAIRDATPQVTGTLNRTSHEFARTIEDHSSGLASTVTKHAMEVAQKLGKEEQRTGFVVPDMETVKMTGQAVENMIEQSSTAGPILAGLAVLFAVCSGYIGYQRCSRSPSRRSPMLLSEAIEFSSHGAGRGLHVDPASEPCFRSF